MVRRGLLPNQLEHTNRPIKPWCHEGGCKSEKSDLWPNSCCASQGNGMKWIAVTSEFKLVTKGHNGGAERQHQQSIAKRYPNLSRSIKKSIRRWPFTIVCDPFICVLYRIFIDMYRGVAPDRTSTLSKARLPWKSYDISTSHPSGEQLKILNISIWFSFGNPFPLDITHITTWQSLQKSQRLCPRETNVKAFKKRPGRLDWAAELLADSMIRKDFQKATWFGPNSDWNLYRSLLGIPRNIDSGLLQEEHVTW